MVMSMCRLKGFKVKLLYATYSLIPYNQKLYFWSGKNNYAFLGGSE